jgi:hypothetical protein
VHLQLRIWTTTIGPMAVNEYRQLPLELTGGIDPSPVSEPQMPQDYFQPYLSGEKGRDELTPQAKEDRLSYLQENFPQTYRHFGNIVLARWAHIRAHGLGGEQYTEQFGGEVELRQVFPDMTILSEVSGYLPGIIANIASDRMEEESWTNFCFIPEDKMVTLENRFAKHEEAQASA